MKNIVVIICLFFSNFSFSKGSDFSLPDYFEVIDSFYTKYSVSKFEDSLQVGFEKRKEGWFAVLTDFSNERRVVARKFFWSFEKGQYLKIEWELVGAENDNANRIWYKKRDRQRNFLYRKLPYYGYIGWDGDVIKDFGDSKNLPDSTLYAVGRAYSTYASNLLNNNSGFSSKKQRFVPIDSSNVPKEKELKEYRYYRHKAIEKYKELKQRNSSFKTFIGYIDTQISNEYLLSFLDLSIYFPVSDAKKELVDSLYSGVLGIHAKNVLLSCSKNSILLSSGDNVTYSLLYTQSWIGIRNDVLIVDVNLLNNVEYIKSLKKDRFGDSGLDLNYSDMDLKKKHLDFVYVEERKKEPTPGDLDSIISLSDGTVSFVNKAKDRVQLNKLSFDQVYDYVKNVENLVPIYNEEKIVIPYFLYNYLPDSSFIVTEIESRYLTRGDLVVIDLINENSHHRSISFTQFHNDRSYLNLENHLMNKGLVYQLIYGTIKDKLGYGYDFIINDTLIDSMFVKVIDWGFLDNINDPKNTNSEKSIFNCYNDSFISLIGKLISNNEKEKAKKVLSYYFETFPNSIIPFGRQTKRLMCFYYRLGMNNEGNDVAKIILGNIEKANYFFNYSKKSQEYLNKKTIKEIKQIGVNFNNQFLMELCEKSSYN